jgi:hypothetical protein
VIEPHEPPTHPIPLILHVTDGFEVPVTLALNCCCPMGARTTWLGETPTETVEGEPIVRAEVAVAVTSAREITVTVTVDGDGAFVGAV